MPFLVYDFDIMIQKRRIKVQYPEAAISVKIYRLRQYAKQFISQFFLKKYLNKVNNPINETKGIYYINLYI